MDKMTLALTIVCAVLGGAAGYTAGEAGREKAKSKGVKK
jgi:hypothetical protein